MVQMRHPKLPEGQTIEVPEIGVKHRERAGWQRVKPEEPAEKPPEKQVEKKPVGKADAKPSNNTEGES